ncbi:MAG: uroporphyrinogen decarboxylase family protein [Clostridiaceae bacterium]|nr:uroporphyrinogen decarboxylase family protein [Clostridiaceae bacterium]
MIKRERVLATIGRLPVDRAAKWLGHPSKEALPILYDYFHVNEYAGLKKKIDDDIWEVEAPYHNGTTNAIYAAFDFQSEKSGYTLTKRGYFADHTDQDEIDDFAWPDPEKYLDPAECKISADAAPEGYAVMGMLWSAHFQDACAAFGMEEALIKMKTEPVVFKKVIDRIVAFYLKANEIFYQATIGKLDMVLMGNDFGTQLGLLCSPEDLRTFVFDGTKRLIDQAHRYGLKVVYHSCGAIFDIIPDLIRCGADVIHPIQALARGMEPEHLKQAFSQQISFCGGVDTQELLVHGTPDDVRQKARQLTDLFPTGLIISPSHEAVMPDVPPENIEALFRH